jgi:hypothetical protein
MMSELKPCPTAGDYDMADRIILSAARDIENGNIGGNGWLAVLLAEYRTTITRTFTKVDVENPADALKNVSPMANTVYSRQLVRAALGALGEVEG